MKAQNGTFMYTFRDFYIPERMMDGIKRYVEGGLRPGRFLTAVIENNLSNACGFADDENMSNLPAYAAFFTTKYRVIVGDQKKR